MAVLNAVSVPVYAEPLLVVTVCGCHSNPLIVIIFTEDPTVFFPVKRRLFGIFLSLLLALLSTLRSLVGGMVGRSGV